MKRILLVCLAIVLMAGAAHASSIEQSREARLDGDFAKAASILRSAAASDKANASMYLYLAADSLYLQKKYADAIPVLDSILSQYKDSKWYWKALFKKADCLMALGKFEDAEKIYDTQTNRLLSAERKLKIASIYINYADDFFKPPEKDATPDYNRAIQFYRRALAFQIPEEKEFPVRLRVGLAFYNLGQYAQAQPEFEAIIKTEKVPQEIAAEAIYYSGLCRLNQRQMAGARKMFKDYLSKHLNGKNAADASFKISETYGLPNPVSLKELELGVAALRDFIEKFSQNELAPEAAWRIALSYYNMRRYEEAVTALEKLNADYGRRADLDQVPQAKILLGSCYFDQEKFPQAIEAWKKYLAEHPNHSGWSNASSRIIDAEFAIAKKLLKQKKYDDATAEFEKFLDRHPLDGRAADAMFELGNIPYVQEQYKDAIALWEKLISKYPGTERASFAQFLTGEINEKKFGDPEAAYAIYQKVTGSYQSQARQRMQEMKKKQLAVLTERAFTTAEPAKLKITLRNMPKLQFRAYRIDMEAYFKKYHTYRDIEKLDINLIDPDKTWEYEVKDYKKMYSHELDVALPLKESGVYAITVGDDEIESTTMLMVTDIAVIVKESKNTAFVFAEDMRTGRPAAGVRVLISNGSEVFEAGKTAADGVLQYSGDKLKTAADTGILALQGGSIASNKLNIGDFSFIEPAKSAGVIFTERPAYRPGQKISAKGIVRDSASGIYTFKAGEKYVVSLLSPGGVELSKKTIPLSEFGTFAFAYQLDPDAQTGLYTIHAAKDAENAQVIAASVTVEQYKLERVKLTVAPERKIYFRGEPAKVKISAKYYFGQPVAGKKVEYRNSHDNLQISAETDANGEVEFTIDTVDYEENEYVNIYATLPDERVAAGVNFWVAATEFDMSVETLRDLYLAGESVEVTVKSRDLMGEPVAADVRLEVLRQVTESGTTSEVRVQEAAMSGADKGINKATVKLTEGGNYILRAFSKDRFGNPIAAQKSIFISGDEDTNRLRIITEREEFRVGETPSVKVVFREKPALALVTYEIQSVYRYKLVELKEGENSVPINIVDDLVPNFTLAVAVMSGNRFFTADKEFSAIKGLKISIEPDGEVFVPGAKMKLKLKTTDQNGKPVKAELALAMVDEALYSLYADTVPSLGDFFFGRRRAGGLRTGSSNTFAYNGVTKEIPKEVIEETEKAVAKQAELEGDFDEEVDSFMGTTASRTTGGGRADDSKGYAKEKKRAAPAKPGAVSAEAPSVMAWTSADSAGNGAMYAYGGGAEDKPTLPPARLREFFPETGYWNPAVITGVDGMATLEITMPDTATTWRLTTRGVTADTLLGEKTAQVITRQEFFVTVKQPAALVEGSSAGFEVEVHNLTEKDIKADVTVTLDVDGVSRSDTKSIELKAKSPGSGLFKFQIPAGRKASLEVDAKGGGLADRVKIEIPVSPYGVELAEVRSGVASENASVNISLPKASDITAPELSISISPSLERSVLDVDFYGWTNNDTALEAISVAYRLDYLEKTGGKDSPSMTALAARLKGLVMRLVTNMNSDGSWTWTYIDAPRKQSDVEVTANAVWALALAKNRGIVFPDNVLETSSTWLKSRFSKEKDDDAKAKILHSLAYLQKADFAYLNRLDRERGSLSAGSIAYIVLGYISIGRPELAAEGAAFLENEIAKKLPPYDAAEIGLAMLAVQAAKPGSPMVAELKKQLEASRWGENWGSSEATMAAGSALAVFYSKTAHAADRYTLSIVVNGKEIKTIQADSATKAQKMLVPAELVQAAGDNRIDFKINGRGSFAYSAVIKGFTKEVPSDKSEKGLHFVELKFVMSPPKFKGKEFAPGYTVRESGAGFKYAKNITNESGLGDYVSVSVSMAYPPEYDESNIVEVPVPAGCSVDKESITGGFEHYEIKDDRIVFYCTSSCGSLGFKVYGYLPGKYRMLPAAIYKASAPMKKLYLEMDDFNVLARGETPAVKYELSPDQMYNLGKAYFDEKMYREAGEMLSRLLTGFELKDEPFREAHKMLMYVCIEKDDSKCIVEHFEKMKERYPSLSIEFKDVLRVGKAYRDIKEFERAIQIYRAALESSFMSDGETRIFLEDQGKFLDSISFLDDLALEYPDLNIVQNAVYSNGQTLSSRADKADAIAELKQKGIKKNDLLRMAVRSLYGFMMLYPESPYIDEAGFSLVGAYLSGGQNEEVVAMSKTMQARYPKSPFLDSFQYLEAYADFELGQYDKALALCSKIATGEYMNSSGELDESDIKNQAVYVTAQIYHALNKPDKAAEYYEKVAEDFSDAAGALDYFNIETFFAPELTTATTGGQAKIVLTHRNISDVEVMVYRVDLMKFYLLRKSMQGMESIQLSGVKPIFEKKISLSKGREYRDKQTSIPIPLTRDGAYLFVMRSGGLYTSGMLLRTNLELEVQEDDASGNVRVNVLDKRSGKYVSRAHVKVVGSGDGHIQSGNTDLRGIFTAEGISGAATVLVKKDDQYAFYTGELELEPSAPSSEYAPVDFDAMRGSNIRAITDDNIAIQERNESYLRGVMKKQDGIQIQQIQMNNSIENNDELQIQQYDNKMNAPVRQEMEQKQNRRKK